MKPGRYLIIVIKKTPEFGQVIMFGKGGGKVEEEKDIAFRVLPITKKEAESLIKDIKFYDTLKKDNINLKLILENILRISELTKKYPNIIELDINPLIVSSEELNVIDARIILED
jgi:hypothetical protein